MWYFLWIISSTMLKGDIHGGPVWEYLFNIGLASYIFLQVAYLGKVALLNNCSSLKSVNEKGRFKKRRAMTS